MSATTAATDTMGTTASRVRRPPAPPAPSTTAPAPRPAARRRTTAAVARRRLLAGIVVAVAVLAVWAALASSSQASPDVGVLEVTVVVGPGETVWDVAADYLPPGEGMHTYVASVLRHNDVDASAITAGTVLHLPRP